jgi:hypothetical protein
MEEILDIFRNDAFSYTSLQRVVDNAPYVPTQIGGLRVYDPHPITTREVLIYEKDGGFALIPYTEIGAPDVQQVRREGRLYGMSTKRVSKKDTVRAGELTGLLHAPLNQGGPVRAAMTLVNDRTIQLKSDMEATKEFARLAGLDGKVVHPLTGEVLFDFFDVFGITRPDPIEVDFTSANLNEDEALMFFQETVYQPMQLALRNRWTPTTSIGALCGDLFWGKLMRNKAFREIYKLEMQAQAIARANNPLVRPNNWTTVYFGGVYWTHFRGSTGGEIDIQPDQARLFPIGAKDVFGVYFSPGEKLQDATLPGRPEFLYLEVDPRQNPEYIDVLLRSYFLYACIFPQALLTLELA